MISNLTHFKGTKAFVVRAWIYRKNQLIEGLEASGVTLTLIRSGSDKFGIYPLNVETKRYDSSALAEFDIVLC